MKFIVSRTSKWNDDAPCEGAIRFNLPYVQTNRQCHTFEEYDKFSFDGRKWTDNGENHRINNDGFIERTMYKSVWCIEINSLEELLKFQSECVSELIIYPNWLNSNYYEIEIYDSFRE